MKISEVSDSELAKWIAEKLEPTPKEWQLDGPYLKYKYRVYFADRHWEPRDMVNDPAMTVMLMEHWRNHPGSVIVAYKDGWRGFIYDGGSSNSDSDAKPLGRAVAEAYALSQGWSK